MRPRFVLRSALAWVLVALLAPVLPRTGQAVPPPGKNDFTLERFFSFVSLEDVEISPDGGHVLVTTRTRDFTSDRIASWIWRVDLVGDSSRAFQLTRGGADWKPRWSPDGEAFAFLGERGDSPAQVYWMPAFGGEPRALTQEALEVRDFTWMVDGRSLVYSVGTGEIERDSTLQLGDSWRFNEDPALTAVRTVTPEGSQFAELARFPFDVRELSPSPDGSRIAFLSGAPGGQEERPGDTEIWIMGAGGLDPHALTHNATNEEQELAWSEDGREVYFVATGDVDAPGPTITQARLYRVPISGSRPEWIARGFDGSVGCALLGAPSYLPPRRAERLLVTAQRGLDAPPAELDSTGANLRSVGLSHGISWGWSPAVHSPRVAFLHSDSREPPELWIAPSRGAIRDSRAVTDFNAALRTGPWPITREIRYRAPDGVEVEGLLTWPAELDHRSQLPLLVDLHGGPEFFVGHYTLPGFDQYRLLSASRGFLVFEPNYRGSVGYGDAFHHALVNEPVSRPAADVLAGVEELVRTGWADPARICVTGYSYGGYLTNYLITHSRRFRAAATGAGAVNHVSTWGNHDLTRWGEFLFGGNPYDRREVYERESSFWLLPQVRTATHIVSGELDTTVPTEEAYQLYRGLRLSGSPVRLLVLPGEGHSFSKPSHERAKIVSELDWLQTYGLDLPVNSPTGGASARRRR